VRDQARAKQFYVEKLGCEVAADAPMASDGWRWVELRFPGSETTLHLIRAPQETASDHPVLVLVEEDVPGCVERLRSRGVEILTEPHKPGRTVAEFRDSEGNRMVVGSR
jgi:catechol 2,3-dioxygenase-like lactoylglutathione lyase family enzyme